MVKRGWQCESDARESVAIAPSALADRVGRVSSLMPQ